MDVRHAKASWRPLPTPAQLSWMLGYFCLLSIIDQTQKKKIENLYKICINWKCTCKSELFSGEYCKQPLWSEHRVRCRPRYNCPQYEFPSWCIWNTCCIDGPLLHGWLNLQILGHYIRRRRWQWRVFTDWYTGVWTSLHKLFKTVSWHYCKCSRMRNTTTDCILILAQASEF